MASPQTPASGEGMMPLAEFEALEPAVAPPVEESPDQDEPLTRVSDQRLAELKAKARTMIEERLRAKRKQRRLMRGGQEW
ncbi:MAG: hypothetical protein JKY65_14255 [Planctomycetes bacterium]|nr:hypothetical protein [Planctomycetota bacterium]